VSRSGGRAIADALAAHGVDRVFMVPGESFVDTLDGLYALGDRMHVVTCRFEGGAVYMAEAAAKLTGWPGVAMVTRGPGACHGAIGVHTAQQDATPLLLFVGQIPTGDTDRDAFQEIDYRRMFGGVAKWVTQIDDAARIPELVAHAFDVATSGRPGPVVIAIPEDMQKQQTDALDVGPRPLALAQPSADAMARIGELLAEAQRPLLLLGGFGWSAAGREAIHAFARTFDLPVAVSFRRQSVYDGMASTYVGDLGVGADPALVAKVRESDCLIAVGTRLGAAVTQGYSLVPKNGAPLVHVYPDASEIGRVCRPLLGIACDPSAFALEAARLVPGEIRWHAWTRDLRRVREAGRAVPAFAGRLNFAQVLHDLALELPADAIVTSDAGNFAAWPTRFMEISAEQRLLGPGNGAMGYGVPAAVAAQLLFPDRVVVGIVGDGGFLMTGQEVATAVHHGVAPIFLVCNNAMYATIRMHQERHYPGRVVGTALSNPDFAQLMTSFGGYGETVTETAAFVPAFRRARASRKPALIELQLDPEQITSRATIEQVRRDGETAHRTP
jgi:acetolactate synthase I/II/III large subunit